jgi:serine/threonine protein kinase
MNAGWAMIPYDSDRRTQSGSSQSRSGVQNPEETKAKGMSLAEWLDRGGHPSVELVLRIGCQIAAGLSAAHRRNLIHRDIKPANIWLEAQSGRVKILDFGMGRSESAAAEVRPAPAQICLASAASSTASVPGAYPSRVIRSTPC